MTRKKWAKLSPEEQRIKVAELHEIYDDIRYVGEHGSNRSILYVTRDGHGKVWETNKLNILAFPCPDYLNDLNAMHEAEKMLFTGPGTEHLEYEFADHLGEIVPDKPTDITHWMVHATAAQRAEAFVLTMDKE